MSIFDLVLNRKVDLGPDHKKDPVVSKFIGDKRTFYTWNKLFDEDFQLFYFLTRHLRKKYPKKRLYRSLYNCARNRWISMCIRRKIVIVIPSDEYGALCVSAAIRSSMI